MFSHAQCDIQQPSHSLSDVSGGGEPQEMQKAALSMVLPQLPADLPRLKGW